MNGDAFGTTGELGSHDAPELHLVLGSSMSLDSIVIDVARSCLQVPS